MNYPILYGKPTAGDKVKKWELSIIIEDEKVFIVRHHGYDGYKMSTSKKEVHGKNIGKKNETSPYEQGQKECESLWKKQVESGYSENKNDLQQSFLPMLAHDYTKRGKSIMEPFYAQPKIDGVRLNSDNCGNLMSRTGKQYNGLEHIKNAIKSLNLTKDTILDGELFTFDLDFEHICSACRKSKSIDDNQKLLKFYIFDVYTHENLPFEKRYELLKQLKLKDPLVLVHTQLLNKKDLILDLQAQYLHAGYEGIMLRNTGGLYKPNYRSVDLQKYKQFTDDEYKIVDYSEALGNDKGTVVFICETKSNKRFCVRPRGSREQRKQWFENFEELCKNKMLTVKYQNLTEYDIPRFPVGISIRDYE